MRVGDFYTHTIIFVVKLQAEYIGSNRPCEDFDKLADGFNEIHQGLKSGKYRLVKFSIKNLQVGKYFVEDGVIGYLAAFEHEAVDKYGTRDGRTRIIYENGSESDIKFKTLTKNLSVTGYSIQDCTEMTDEEFEECFTINDNDIESGTIYVLRSKSTLPEIAAIKDLYKIGLTIKEVLAPLNFRSMNKMSLSNFSTRPIS